MMSYRDETFTEQYAQESLPSLFLKQTANIDHHHGQWMTVQAHPVTMTQTLEAAQQTLLIATAKLADSFIDTLQRIANRGVRIYLVLGADEYNRRAIDALMGRCLIRTGIAQQGTLILTDHQSSIEQGCVLSAQLDNSHTRLKLSSSQIQDYYRLFCHLFWHLAQNEYIQGMQADHKTEDSPEGLVELNHQDILPQKITHLVAETWDQTGIANLAQPEQFSELVNQQKGQRILLSTAHIQGDVIAQLEQICTTLALTDATHLPSLISTEACKTILLPQNSEKDEVNWCVNLNPEQHSEAKLALANWHMNADWQMKTKPRISEILGKFRLLTQADQVLECLANRTVNVPEIHTATMDDFFNIPVHELAKDHCGSNLTQLAHEIHYQVRIHPPYLPDNAALDPLYQHWRTAKESWQQHIQEQHSKIDLLAKEHAAISDSLKTRIRGLLTEQQTSLKGLTHRIATLSQWTPEDQSSDIRAAQLLELQDIAAATQTMSAELDLEVAKAAAEEKWLKDKKDTEQEIETLAIKELELQDQVDQLKSRYSQNQHEFWQNLHDQIKASMDKKTEGAKDHPKHIIEKLNDLKDENELKNWSKAPEIPKSVKNDIQVKLSQRYEAFDKKAQRELKELTDPLNKAKSELSRLQSYQLKIGETFIYQAKQTGSNDAAKAPSTPRGINWPSEELPRELFKLHKDKIQRWLVMSEPADFAQAQLDAHRLKAKICVSKKAS